MSSRRNFLATTFLGGAALASTKFFPTIIHNADAADASPKRTGYHYKLPYAHGLGGVAIGNGFMQTPDKDATATLEAAWASGVRYYDTSPFYGYGLSERRFGAFLDDKKRDEFVISTKVGRVFHPSSTQRPGLWKNPSHFDYRYDYTAAGTRRSIEDSLQRLGLDRIDIVFIHDLSPDNKDLGKDWVNHFETARTGAMKELSKMRDEGIIKGWGLGVNEIDPILKTLDVSDPDIFLSATQYSLIKHDDALKRLLPACEKHGVQLVIGAPLNAGFLAGVDRYNYGGTLPDGVKEKRSKMEAIAKKHGVDLRTAALQFSKAPGCVAAVIPGCRHPEHANENARSLAVKIPGAFWKELKKEQLIAPEAPEPANLMAKAV